MSIHRSLNDLSKHLGTSSGVSMLLNQSSIKETLQREGERFQRYLTEEIDRHYSSFTPEYYHRTGAWIESVRLNPVKQIGNQISISITFDDNFAYHPSVAGGEDGYVPWLMEVGWKDTSYTTPHFQGFQGSHYIKDAVERWNLDNKLGLVISVYRNGERYI